MSEWWSYRPSDFLLFAPRTYYRLVELHNTELWPAQIVAIAACLLLFALGWRGSRHAGRVIAGALAVSWAFVGWRFHWHHYSSINWAAVHFAAAFALEAMLFGWAALRGELVYGGARRPRRFAGLVVVIVALALVPLVALALGRPMTQLEVAGLAPDPTAVFTLGLLLLARRAHWSLYVIPLLWCLVSGLTLWTMKAGDAWVPVFGATLALAAVLGTRPARA